MTSRSDLPQPPARTIAVVMACHNRRELTLKCIRSLLGQQGHQPRAARPSPHGSVEPSVAHGEPNTGDPFELLLYLADDGCTDGTADAVTALWPGANILRGDGNLFWCGGMRVAWAEASRCDPDYYLLVNDDTEMLPEALDILLGLAESPDAEIICVAPIADPETGRVVFGGHEGHTATPIEPQGVPVPCDTMNANCTLVTRAVFRKIGMFHAAYTHAMGDFDYGFAATRAGIRIVQAAKVLGISKPNPITKTWRDTSLSRAQRFRLLWLSPKGLPFFEWMTYARRNLGPLWPYRTISPALRILAGK